MTHKYFTGTSKNILYLLIHPPTSQPQWVIKRKAQREDATEKCNSKIIVKNLKNKYNRISIAIFVENETEKNSVVLWWRRSKITDNDDTILKGNV